MKVEPLSCVAILTLLTAGVLSAFPAYVYSPPVTGGIGQLITVGYANNDLDYKASGDTVSKSKIVYSTPVLVNGAVIPVNVSYSGTNTLSYQFTPGGVALSSTTWAADMIVFWVRKVDASDAGLIASNPSIITGAPSTVPTWLCGSTNPNPWQLLTDSNGNPCVALTTGGYDHSGELLTHVGSGSWTFYFANTPMGSFGSNSRLKPPVASGYQTVVGYSPGYIFVPTTVSGQIASGSFNYNPAFTGYELVAEECDVQAPNNLNNTSLTATDTWQKIGYVGGIPPVEVTASFTAKGVAQTVGPSTAISLPVGSGVALTTGIPVTFTASVPSATGTPTYTWINPTTNVTVTAGGNNNSESVVFSQAGTYAITVANGGTKATAKVLVSSPNSNKKAVLEVVATPSLMYRAWFKNSAPTTLAITVQ